MFSSSIQTYSHLSRIYPQFFFLPSCQFFQNPFPTQWLLVPEALLAKAISFFALMASMVGINLWDQRMFVVKGVRTCCPYQYVVVVAMIFCQCFF